MQKTNTSMTQSLAEKIKTARNAAHISQASLGKSLGLSDKSISAYEKGRSIPPLETLQQIAKETKKTLTYFTQDEDEGEDTILDKLRTIEMALREVKEILIKQKRNS